MGGKIIRRQINLKYTNGLINSVLLLSIAIVMLSCIGAASADSSMIYVSDSGGNDDWDGLSWSTAKLSIKNATGTVTNGGTVNIADGIYTGVNNTNITIDKNITIQGQSRDGTVINGDNSAQIFVIQNNTNVTIKNLTFKNGNGTQLTLEGENVTYGGAIFNNGTLTVENSAFTGNAAVYGGAILNGGTLIISDSTFTNNTANGSTNLTMGGGAIINYANLTITGSTFTGNTVIGTNENVAGGGAIVNHGNLAINSSFFINNTVNNGIFGYGGAVLSYGNSTVKNSVFTNNTANFGGSVINYGNSTVTGSIFTNNTADTGGAIINCGNLTVSSNNFLNNTANGTNEGSMGGGAIANVGNLTVGNNNVFTGNNAFFGGAISNFGGNSAVPVTILGSTFRSNTAQFGGAVYNYGTLKITSSTFIDNSARSTDENTAYEGGAICNGGVLEVRSSTISGNTADFGGAIANEFNSTALIVGSTISRNSATLNGDAIYNAGKLVVRYSRLAGNCFTGYAPEDVFNDGGSADVNYNWWGSNAGPTTGRVVGATTRYWMVLTLTASPTTVKAGGKAAIAADLLHDNYGNYRNPANGHVPDGIIVSFTTKFGTIGSQASTVNGIAQTALKAGSTGGTVTVSAKTDGQTVQIPLKVIASSPKNYATGFSRTATIAIKFSQNIKSGINWSKIYIKNLKTGKLVSISKWISGDTLYIKTSTRYAYNWYQIYIPASAVKDYSGRNLATRYVFKFKTGR